MSQYSRELGDAIMLAPTPDSQPWLAPTQCSPPRASDPGDAAPSAASVAAGASRKRCRCGTVFLADGRCIDCSPSPRTGGSSGSGFIPKQRAAFPGTDGLTDQAGSPEPAAIPAVPAVAPEPAAVPAVPAVVSDDPDFDVEGFHQVVRPPLMKCGAVELYEFQHRNYPDGTAAAADLQGYLVGFGGSDARGWTLAVINYGGSAPAAPSTTSLPLCSFIYGDNHMELLFNKSKTKLKVPSGSAAKKVALPKNPTRRSTFLSQFLRAVCDGGRNFNGTLGCRLDADAQIDVRGVQCAVEGLSRAQYATMRTNAILIPPKDRTAFHAALVRGGDRLESAIFDSAARPPQVRIVCSDPDLRPPSAFKWDLQLTTWN